MTNGGKLEKDNARPLGVDYATFPFLLLQSWHKRCFTCAACSRHLDSFTVNDAPDGEIYCKACYGHKFGVRGVGFGMGAGALNMVRSRAFGEIRVRSRRHIGDANPSGVG